jgi:hypothetical protein
MLIYNEDRCENDRSLSSKQCSLFVTHVLISNNRLWQGAYLLLMDFSVPMLLQIGFVKCCWCCKHKKSLKLIFRAASYNFVVCYGFLKGVVPDWPPLWSGGQSSWLQNGDVLCFLWGTNWIYVCYVEKVDRLCSLVVRDPGYRMEMRCASCELWTKCIYVT